MATDVAEVRTVPEASTIPLPRLNDAWFGWFCLFIANILAWSEGSRLGQFVSGLSIAIFGTFAFLSRLAQFLDERRASRCRGEVDSLKAKIAELEAENRGLRAQTDRPA